jgi:GMP synthase (glutamine-hydrolysing)
LILSGGPHSVYETDAPEFNEDILNFKGPILGLCYGHQLICHVLGGHASGSDIREYGIAGMEITADSPIFRGLESTQTVWMSHGDSVDKLPGGFEIIAKSRDCAMAAVQNSERRIYGLQFHPEVIHTQNGNTILDNFLNLCGCSRDWNMEKYLKSIEKDLKSRLEGKNLFLLVSGGVDSTVTFALLNRALGTDRVQGLHIDNGLMRENETSRISRYMADFGFDNLHIADASSEFLEKLEGITDPEEKRKIIGDAFISVQQSELEKMGLDPNMWVLGQGTIYPDTIESGGTKHADTIKTHHNRVPIIEKLIEQGKIIEPIAQLYKDEVRILGKSLDLPDDLIWRHPFPGPGLGVRVLCSSGENKLPPESVKSRLDSLLQGSGLKADILPIRSVGVQGDSRSYAHPAIITGDSDWDRLEELSTKITNTIPEINRIVFQIAPGDELAFKARKAWVTGERLEELRKADSLLNSFIKEHGFYRKIWQMPVVSLPISPQGDRDAVVMRPVHSREAMTASFYRLPMDFLKKIGRELTARTTFTGLFFDVTHKPPATIEWE